MSTKDGLGGVGAGVVPRDVVIVGEAGLVKALGIGGGVFDEIIEGAQTVAIADEPGVQPFWRCWYRS